MKEIFLPYFDGGNIFCSSIQLLSLLFCSINFWLCLWDASTEKVAHKTSLYLIYTSFRALILYVLKLIGKGLLS